MASVVCMSTAVGRSCVISVQSVILRREGRVDCTGERRGLYRVLVGKPEGKRPLVRPSRRWVFRKFDVGVWNGSSWLRIGTLANAVMNIRVP